MRKVLISLVVLFAALPAAAGIKARSDVNSKFDLGGYRTWSWAPAPDRPEGHPLASGSALAAEIRQTIEEELAADGLRPAATGDEADVLVDYWGMIEDRLESEGASYQLTDHIELANPAGLPTRSYKRGTIGVHLIDAASGEVAWRGWASDVADRPDELMGKAAKAIRKIFKRYPPK